MMIAAAAVASSVLAGNVSAEPRRVGNLLPPVSPACISSPFGPRVLPNQPEAGTYHYGIDLPAPVGAPVMATAPGTVIRLQNKGPGGLEMLVQHDGFVGIYSHFSMVTPAFAEGKRNIAAGEQLGAVGITGVTSGAHLYFEMDLAGKPVDPAPYIGVPDCNGSVRRTLSRTLDADGKPRQYLPVSVRVAVLPVCQAVPTIGSGVSLDVSVGVGQWPLLLNRARQADTRRRLAMLLLHSRIRVRPPLGVTRPEPIEMHFQTVAQDGASSRSQWRGNQRCDVNVASQEHDKDGCQNGTYRKRVANKAVPLASDREG